MLLINEKSMFSIGYVTTGLYLLSLTFFLIGAFNKALFIPWFSLGTVFFLIPSIIIGIMVRMRMER